MSTSQNNYRKDIFFMGLALQQAKKILGNTNGNPAVGCVITQNGSMISAAHTSFNGRPHAEVNALKLIPKNLKNSKLYVTLEPCSHYGKTPPCIKEIIKKNIKKVYFSVFDPDIRSFNKSTKTLKKNKIYVNVGLNNKKIKEFYKSYFLYKNTNFPFVTAKLAISKDYFMINKKKKWITNVYSRSRVHLMRSLHDCIITSSTTIINDNPLFTCRIAGIEDRTPPIIILDRNLRLSHKLNIIKKRNSKQIIIFYNNFNRKKINILKDLGISAYKIPLNNNGNLDLKRVLIKAKKLSFSRIFLESGIKLSKSFLKMNLVNHLNIFISNDKLKRIGDDNIGSFLKKYLKNKKAKVEKVNLFNEKLISYKIK